MELIPLHVITIVKYYFLGLNYAETTSLQLRSKPIVRYLQLRLAKFLGLAQIKTSYTMLFLLPPYYSLTLFLVLIMETFTPNVRGFQTECIEERKVYPSARRGIKIKQISFLLS